MSDNSPSLWNDDGTIGPLTELKKRITASLVAQGKPNDYFDDAELTEMAEKILNDEKIKGRR